MAFLALLAFGIGHVYFDQENGYAVGRTMAFAVLSLSQLVHAFNMRGEGSLGKLPFCSNKWLLMAFVVGVALQCVVIMMPPLAGIFQVVPLNGEQWLLTAALALAPLPLVELEKAVWHPKQK